MSRLHATALACSSLLLSACLGIAPHGKLEPILDEDVRIKGWLERISRQGEALRSLRAVGKLRIRSQAGGGSVKEVILVQRPGQLRLESLGLLGNSLNLLVTDGQSFSFFDGRSLERGVVDEQVLSQRLGLALTPSEAIEVLLGSIPRNEWPPARILGSETVRQVWLTGQRLLLGPSGELLEVETLAANGRVRWVVRYGKYQELPGGTYPFAVDLIFPDEAFNAELRFSDVELNPSLSSALFRVAWRKD
ncbi:MAG: hypothetical protein GY725_09685 [bacterium]|nr:hypothetical protein [bacterium]